MFTLGLYRHFKGEYYMVQNVVKNAITDELMCYYFNVLHPELGFFVRPMREWFDLNTDVGPIIDRRDNVTGQRHRFEKVVSIDNQVKNLSTEQLVNELIRREDSPLHELDLRELQSRVFSRDYIVGEKNYETEDFPRGVTTLAVFSTPKDAYECRSKYPSPRYGVFKRTFIEL